MKRAGLALACALLAGAAAAQAPCPLLGEVAPSDLLGAWKAEFEGSWEVATLTLQPHPEYSQSFRGTLERAGQGRQALVAGDFEDGDFTLEESADGQRIAATWVGALVEGSCGRQIRGTWTRDGAPAGRGFVLRRP